MIDTTFYGTIDEANQYFQSRLHSGPWFESDPADRPKALWAATQIIDTLNFKDRKHSVWLVFRQYMRLNQDGVVLFAPAIDMIWLTPEYAPPPGALRDAEAAQLHEFPRGSDTVAPQAICYATYEIAYSLLDGKDPELELEALGVSQQSYGSVQTTYSRNNVPLEHLINGVPNVAAWRLIRPFLRQADQVKLSRVS